jgi:hypothetical protein
MAAGVLSLLSATVARAQEPGEGTPSAAPPAEAPPPPARPPGPNVTMDMVGRVVVVTTPERSVEGKLVALNDHELVVQRYSKEQVTIERTAILSVRLPYGGSDLFAPAGTTVDHAPGDDAAEQPPGALVDEAPSAWGFWGGIAVGPAWGGKTGPAAPAGLFSLDFGLSYHFVYVGTGFGVTWFGGVASFSNETTDGTRDSGAPASLGGYIEAGLTKGLFLPYSATQSVELRPGVGYGLWGMTEATQSIGKCVDCDSRSFAYNGGHYVRFQLGVFYSEHPEGSVVHRVFMSRNGLYIGGTVSLQEFVFGAEPRLDRVLTFALTTGWGR